MLFFTSPYLAVCVLGRFLSTARCSKRIAWFISLSAIGPWESHSFNIKFLMLWLACSSSPNELICLFFFFKFQLPGKKHSSHFLLKTLNTFKLNILTSAENEQAKKSCCSFEHIWMILNGKAQWLVLPFLFAGQSSQIDFLITASFWWREKPRSENVKKMSKNNL